MIGRTGYAMIGWLEWSSTKEGMEWIVDSEVGLRILQSTLNPIFMDMS